jgi:tetratricopeptide (TPR) repeat protein
LNDNDCINRDCLAILDLPNLPTEQELLPGVFSTHSGAAARLVTLNEKLGFSAKAAAYARMFSNLQNYSVNAEKALAIKNEGNELFARDQVLDAVEKYRDALRYNPKDYTIHSNLSRCFLLSGDKESAKDHAEKCIKYAPEWSKGWYRLGKVQVQMEAYLDAVKSFEIALDLEPCRLELKRELAEAQYLADKLGNCDPGFDARTQGILYSMSQTSWVSLLTLIIGYIGLVQGKFTKY